MDRGKSFLLSAVFLWCIVNDKKAKAAAPTGVAAANIWIDGTDVAATTVHAMLDLDCELKTKFDFAKLDHTKVQSLMPLEVLLIDEVNLIDTICWECMSTLFSVVGRAKRPRERLTDSFGQLHVILFGDFNQCLPPTAERPFICLPEVHNTFDFRVLRENRRLVVDADRAEEFDEFRNVLNDLARGELTERVYQCTLAAYVRGARAS